MRTLALLDVGSGTLMLIILALVLWQRAWLIAALFAVLSWSSLRALVAGLRTLMRT